jgi:hypothetical protein
MVSRVQRQYFNLNLLHAVKPAGEAAPQYNINRRARARGGTEVSWAVSAVFVSGIQNFKAVVEERNEGVLAHRVPDEVY